LIDHTGEAAKAGIRMPNTKLLIFGNPTAGTPIILASPSAAIDLEPKILVARTLGAQSGFPALTPGKYLRVADLVKAATK
jgi:uncharacterized protein (DUF302 family)